MSRPGGGRQAHERTEVQTNGRSSVSRPDAGEAPFYAPLSPWTRFQGGGFYVMLSTVFGVCWTLLCGAGIYYGMRNVALAKGIGLWDAVSLRAGTGLWLWIQVWLYPIVATQAASLLIRLHYKRKGKPLRQSFSTGPVEPVKR